MNEPDPERLLAEALRAQAVRAPMPDPANGPGSSDVGLRLFSDSPFGLISGQDSTYSSYELPPPPVQDSPRTTRIDAGRPLSVAWIVLLAVLLGLAAGAVIGLVSVL